MIPIFALLTQAASNLSSDASALESSISALERDISALESAAKTLANESASLEPWSWVFTALVAFGVAMEFWVVWHEHRENTETWALTFFGVYRTLRPSFGRLIVEYLSIALVAGGIIGELAVGVAIASRNTQLRGTDSQLRSENAELRSKSNQLIALLEKDVEDERYARVAIEARVAWRHLTDKQKIDMGRRLHNLHPSEPITVWFFSGDAEGLRFASDIAEMLRAAQMKVFPPREFGPPGPQTVSTADLIKRGEDTGVDITSTKDSTSRSLADAIKQELNNCGFDAAIIASEGPVSLAQDIGPNVLVAVKARPSGPQGEAKLQVQAANRQSSQTTKP